MNEVIKRNQSAAGNYSHDAICPRCHTPYDSHAYHKGMCGSCERIAQTKKRRMTDGERDLVDFMERSMGFQLKNQDYT